MPMLRTREISDAIRSPIFRSSACREPVEGRQGALKGAPYRRFVLVFFVAGLLAVETFFFSGAAFLGAAFFAGAAFFGAAFFTAGFLALAAFFTAVAFAGAFFA